MLLRGEGVDLAAPEGKLDFSNATCLMYNTFIYIKVVERPELK